LADGSRIFDTPRGPDPTVLTAVYRAHAGYVWRVLRHCGVPDPDLDDAVQETFLVVFRRLPELERASLRTWIYAVAVRVASTRRRSQRREAARRDRAGDRMHGAGAADPEAELSKAEAADLVDRLLAELDAPKRTVFVLAELEGVKVPEISRILGVNPRTVHSRLRLARECFGSALRRLQAHEANNRRVARLRPGPLLEQAANDRPPAARRKAAMAALCVRMEQGAMPMLAGWEAVTLAGASGAWALPGAVLMALGTVVAVLVVTRAPTVDTGSLPSEAIHEGTRAAETRPSSMRMPTSASVADEPIMRAGSTIMVPLVPNGRSGATTSDMSGARGRSGSRIGPLGGSTVRTDATIELAGPSDSRSTTERRAPREPDGRTHATSSSEVSTVPSTTVTPATDATASTLAAETRLLEQARSALRGGDSDAALAALDSHASEFPRGILLDEARSTRLRALCAAGRSDEAATLADRLAPGEPRSRWHDVVRASCR
jgi:RNA polymerase sigma-70 factor, ECF subfamily